MPNITVSLNHNHVNFITEMLSFAQSENLHPSASNWTQEQFAGIMIRKMINAASGSMEEIKAPPSDTEISNGRRSVLRRHFGV